MQEFHDRAVEGFPIEIHVTNYLANFRTVILLSDSSLQRICGYQTDVFLHRLYLFVDIVNGFILANPWNAFIYQFRLLPCNISNEEYIYLTSIRTYPCK